MTVTLSFLGLDVTALVYRTHTGRWEIDDLQVMNEGHDLWEVLNDTALMEIEERVIDEATKQDYRWV